MTKSRLEAFSDGVIAIIITIMVLELEVPHGIDLHALQPLWPVFLAYVLSFVHVGIYWNNHHHMLHAATKVSGAVLWANQHLLFWLSLVPFTTAWMGENHFAAIPTATYGVNLVCCALAWTILQRCIITAEGAQSRVQSAVGSDRKGKASLAMYLAAIPLAFVHPAIAFALYVGVELMWLVPDRRFESAVHARDSHPA
jgi:uncharacterized membrane protein